MKSFSALKVLTQECRATLMGVQMGGVQSGGEQQLYLSAAKMAPGSEGASLRRASRQFHALFRDFTHTLFAVPDIIPSTDKTEWEISDSGSDLCNIFVK